MIHKFCHYPSMLISKTGTGNIDLLTFNGIYQIISLKDVPVLGKKQNNFSSFW